MTSRCVSLLAVCLLVVSLNSYAGSGAIHEKKAYPVFQTGTTGAWGHSTHNRVSVGYVQSGRMNLAGVPLILGMTLTHKCGITVHEDAFQRSLVFF